MTKSGKNIKHFIKFLPKLNNITLVKRLGDNWQRLVLDDITENGERIKFLPLLSTYDQSKSITLYGRKFCCKACVDRERNDTLFIFSVSDAALGGPQKSSKEIDGPWGDFCCQGGHVERTISLPPQLLASKSQKACAEFIHPSAQLIDTFERHIRQIEIDLFDIAATERTESNIVLQECRKLWKDFELDKVASVTIRQKRLLNELIISTERVEDVKELTERLSIPVLNAYVNKRGDDRFLELLHRIGRLPLPKENDPTLEENNWKTVILASLYECAAREGADQFEDSVVSLRKTAENSNAAKATDEKSDGEEIVGPKETEPNEETYPGQYDFSKDASHNLAPGYFDADLQEQPCTSFLTEDAVRSEGCKDQDNDVSSAKHSGSEQPNIINIPVGGLIAPIDTTDLFLEEINSEGEAECQNCECFRQCILASKAEDDLLNPEELTAVIDTIQLTPIICLKNIRILAISLLYHEDINRARLAVWYIERRKDFKMLLSKGEFLYNLYNIYQTAEWDPFTMFMFLIDEDERVKSIKNFVNYVFTVNEDENKQKETYSFLRNEANKVMYGSQYKDCIESILVKIQIFTFSKTLQSCQDEVCKIKWKMARHYDNSLDNSTKAQALINSAMLDEKSESAVHKLVHNLVAMNSKTTTDHDYLEETKKFLHAVPTGCLGVIKRIDALDGYRRLPEVFKKHPIDITEIKSIIAAICSAYDRTHKKVRFSLWGGILIKVWINYLKPARKILNKRSNDAISLTKLSIKVLSRIKDDEGGSYYKLFLNLFDMYNIVRLHPTFWPSIGGEDAIRDIVENCYSVGKSFFLSKHPEDLLKREKYSLGAFYYKYGFMCQAFTEMIFNKVEVDNFEIKLKAGIKYINLAIQNSNDPKTEKHFQVLGRCYKGIAGYANKCAHEKQALDEYDEAEIFFYDAITNYEEAIKNLERLIQAPDEAEIRSSTKVEVLMEQGACYLSLGFINIKLENGIQKAHELWDKAESKYLAAHHVLSNSNLTLPPHKTKSSQLLRKFADFYFTTHRPQKALPFYEEIMKYEKAYKKEDKSLFNLYSYRWGVALTFAAKHEQARDKFEETLYRDPSQEYITLIYKQLARIYRILKDRKGYNNTIDRARKTGIKISAPAFDTTDDYSDLVFLDDEPALWFRVQFQQECEEYFRQGRFFKVIKNINKLFYVANQNHLSGYTNDPAILLNLGKSYRMVGDLNRAEENINKALYARATTKNRSYCMKALGDALLDRGEYELAADYYSSTYELEGDCGSLLAAASSYRRCREYNKALNAFNKLVSDPNDKEPIKTMVSLSRTLWEKYTDNKSDKNEEDVGKACNILKDVILGGVSAECIGDRVAITTLVAMTTHQKPINTIAEILIALPSEDIDYIEKNRIIRKIKEGFLTKNNFPGEIITTCLNIIGKNAPSLLEIKKEYVQIMSCVLSRAYYYGSCSGWSFDDLSSQILGEILQLALWERRILLFTLLVRERRAFDIMILSRYANEARNIFDPILSESGDINVIGSEEFYNNLTEFLNSIIPSGVKPVLFKEKSCHSLFKAIQDIVSTFKEEYKKEIEDGDCSLNLEKTKDDGIYYPQQQINKIKEMLIKLLDRYNGPFERIARNSSNVIDIIFDKFHIDLIYNFEGYDDDDSTFRNIKEKICNELHIFQCSGIEVEFGNFTLPNLMVKLRIPLSASYQKEPSLNEEFEIYLDHKTLDFLNGDKRFWDYSDLNDVEALFPEENHPLYANGIETWKAILVDMYESQYATLEKWMVDKGSKIPRGSVHEVKNWFKYPSNREDIDLNKLEDLRKRVNTFEREFYSALKFNALAKGQDLSYLDELNIYYFIKGIIEKFHTASGIHYDLLCSDWIIALGRSSFLKQIFVNLFHNSEKALASPNISDKKITIIVRENGRHISITINNAYDDSVDISGTGIGLSDVKRLMLLQGGSLQKLPPDGNIFSVVLTLKSPEYQIEDF